MTRTHPVTDADERERAIAEYRREDYSVVEYGDDGVVLVRKSSGGLLAHLALFFTVGWLTFGVLNVIYAIHCRAKADRVRVVVR